MVLVRLLKILLFFFVKFMYYFDKILKCDLLFEDSDINIVWVISYYGYIVCCLNLLIGIEF